MPDTSSEISTEADDFLTLHEIAVAARQRLDPQSWDYLMGGTETETTLKRNRTALDSIAFRPRVLRDVNNVDAAGTVLDKKARIPVLMAPIGGIEAFDPLGAAACSKASAAFGIPHMLSSACAPGLEETAAAADNDRIYQLYVRGDDDAVDEIVKRARDNKFRAFCMTVDSAFYSRRERDITSRYVKKWRTNVQGREYQTALSWREVERFLEVHPDYPLILKGIATAEDAAVAAELGVHAVYVSNHGGRQLDHGRGAMDVLPEVVAAVGGRSKVWVDGGIMRGSDVVKAIALGAECVGIGRLQGLGLGAAGVNGLLRTLELLEEEVRICMGLLGVNRLDELSPNFLHPAEPVDTPHALSAFPLIGVPPGG